jgi:hypothetical protein
METLLTQWRSSVGVLKPSPLKMWPMWLDMRNDSKRQRACAY